jgi:hypothetical protein
VALSKTNSGDCQSGALEKKAECEISQTAFFYFYQVKKNAAHNTIDLLTVPVVINYKTQADFSLLKVV